MRYANVADLAAQGKGCSVPQPLVVSGGPVDVSWPDCGEILPVYSTDLNSWQVHGFARDL